MQKTRDKNNMTMVYTTFGNLNEAKELCSKIVGERLAVCANIFSEILSIYKWKDSIINDKEVAVLLKTRDDKIDKLRKRICELHPYDTPVIAEIKCDRINDKYAKWMDECLNQIN